MDDCGGGYSESIAEMCDELMQVRITDKQTIDRQKDKTSSVLLKGQPTGV